MSGVSDFIAAVASAADMQEPAVSEQIIIEQCCPWVSIDWTPLARTLLGSSADNGAVATLAASLSGASSNILPGLLALVTEAIAAEA